MRIVFASLLLFFAISRFSFAQYDEPYVTSGLEIIFSKGGTSNDGNIRFAPVLNLQTNLNYDLNKNLGVYTGLAVRNVGFIYDGGIAGNNPDPNIYYKFRSYNLGLPVGIKIGNMEKAFIYGGYEIELPFNYKEKTFINEVKEDKFAVWFSNRTNTFHHSFFVGLQFFSGMNLKFKYYMNDFHNRDFEALDVNGNTVKPYENLKSNIWTISLNIAVFRNAKFFYSGNQVDTSGI